MLTHTRGSDCVSDLAFDRWLADGAPPEAERVDAHLASCGRCALRLEEVIASREAFLRRQPSWRGLHAAHEGASGAAPPSVATPRAERRRGQVVRLGVLGGLAAAALALIAVLPSSRGPTYEGVRTKGGGSIGAYVKRGGNVSRVVDGDVVLPGDRLRFVYSSDAPVHFALLHHDGASASIYYPLATEASDAKPGRDVPLDFSIRLDAAGDYERLFGVFCSEQVALEPLRLQLERTGRLVPPAHCQVDMLALEKRGAEAPPMGGRGAR